MREQGKYILTYYSWRVCLAAIFLLLVPPDSISAPQSSRSSLRIGFTSSMFNDVNENDAKAAMKAWSLTIANRYEVPVEPEPIIYKNAQDMRAALQHKTVDLVGTSLLDYEMLQGELARENFFFAAYDNEVNEEYLLVARRDGHVKNLEDLEGRHIVLHQHIRLCLAPLWLDDLLIQRGLKPVDSLAGKLTRKNNLSQALLPVFFKQADACVISRRGLETITDLNPQLGQQLMVLESSAKMVPTVFSFRRDYSPPFMEALMRGLRGLHETVEGRQILLVFQCDEISEKSRAVLSSALELISAYSKTTKR